MLKYPNHLTSFWNDLHIEYHKTGVIDYEEIKFEIDNYHIMGLNFMDINQKELMNMFHDVCASYRNIHNTSGHHDNEFLLVEKLKYFDKTWVVYYINL